MSVQIRDCLINEYDLYFLSIGKGKGGKNQIMKKSVVISALALTMTLSLNSFPAGEELTSGEYIQSEGYDSEEIFYPSALIDASDISTAGSSDDISAPFVSGVKLSRTTARTGDEITLTLIIEDASEIDHASSYITFGNGTTTKKIYLQPASGNSYTATATVDEKWTSGEYCLGSCSIRDVRGNINKNDLGKTFTSIKAVVDTENEDIASPEIRGVSIDRTVVRPGGQFILTLIIEDASEIDLASSYITFKNGTVSKKFYLQLVSEKTYAAVAAVDENWPGGEYCLDSCDIRDVNGNVNITSFADIYPDMSVRVINDKIPSAPTATPVPTLTATPTPVPTATPAPKPTATPTPAPTATPAPKPTATPTPAPVPDELISDLTPTPTPVPVPKAAITGLKEMSIGKLKMQAANKGTQVDGYQFRWSLDSTFKTGVKSASSTKHYFFRSGLVGGKTYYVKARTYKIMNGKKVYSSWSGTKSLKLTILPTKPAISSLKKNGTGFTVQWKAVSGVDGYQIRYSTVSDFSSRKTASVTGAGKTSCTRKNLVKGQTYYVSVRSYKTAADGTKYYSKWSAAKSIKIY